MKFSMYNVVYEHDNSFLLVNTLTGAMFSIEPDVKNCLENNDIDSIDEKAFEAFKKSGIIIEGLGKIGIAKPKTKSLLFPQVKMMISQLREQNKNQPNQGDINE